MGSGSWSRGQKKQEGKRGKGAEEERTCGKSAGYSATVMPKRSSPFRSCDAIKMSAKDSQSYVGILREMKARVNFQDAGLEVLSIWKT